MVFCGSDKKLKSPTRLLITWQNTRGCSLDDIHSRRRFVSAKSELLSLKWLLNHYGPYVDDVVKLARDSTDFNLIITRNAYGSVKERLEFVGSEFTNGVLDSKELEVIDEVVRETDPSYFNNFINLVYNTYPVKESNKYSILDLPKFAQKKRLKVGLLSI